MFRKIGLFVLLACAMALLRFDAAAQTPSQARPELRGAWIHTYSALDWEVAMKKLADAGFNAVFVRVARGANTMYPSQILPSDDWVAAAGTDEFQKALDAAHRNGLEFHAWKVNFNVAGASLQKGKARAYYEELVKQDRLARDTKGEIAPFLNPADPRNQELELQVLREMTEKYNVDGIHLDYIRYTEVPHYEFDYSEISRREFEKSTGKRVANWPADVFSGELKWEYENWERHQIDELVRRAYAQTKSLKPNVLVSAAVWRSNRSYRASIKQDWKLWAQSGWLDMVIPMNYTPSNLTFRNDVKSQIPHAAGRVLYAAGIGNYQHKTPENTLQQIEIAREEGADGYVLFDYKPEKYDALLAELAKMPRAPRLPVDAPKVQWQVGSGIERKDEPPAFSIGSTLGVRARVAQVSNVRAELRSLEDAPARDLGAAQTNQNGELGWRFPVTSGRWRFVISGRDDRTGRNFEARGPLLEGLLPASVATLRNRERPPILTGTGTRIAIYAGGQAEAGVLRVLSTAPETNAYSFHQLKPAHWQRAEILVLPQLRDVEEFTPQVVRDLRDWVKNGGTIVLTHDAVGFRWHPRLFPEIGQGAALSKTRDVQVLPNAFGFSPGEWLHEYSDHVTIAPGANGKVIARDKEGQAVLVGGNYGEGKVFLYGALLGFAPTGVLNAGETQLLMDIAKLN